MIFMDSSSGCKTHKCLNKPWEVLVHPNIRGTVWLGCGLKLQCISDCKMKWNEPWKTKQSRKISSLGLTHEPSQQSTMSSLCFLFEQPHRSLSCASNKGSSWTCDREVKGLRHFTWEEVVFLDVSSKISGGSLFRHPTEPLRGSLPDSPPTLLLILPLQSIRFNSQEGCPFSRDAESRKTSVRGLLQYRACPCPQKMKSWLFSDKQAETHPILHSIEWKILFSYNFINPAVMVNFICHLAWHVEYPEPWLMD